MAIAPRKGSVGLAWTSVDDVVRFRAVDATSHAGPTLRVGCASLGAAPSLAAVDDGFLVATLSPEGAHDIFYKQVSPTLRIRRIPPP